MGSKAKRVMLQVHRPGRLIEAAVKPIFLGMIAELKALPAGTVVDQCPSMGLGILLGQALRSSESLGHLHRAVRVLVSPNVHSGEWTIEHQRTILGIISGDAHETLVEAAIRKPDNKVDMVKVGRLCRDHQLADCTDLLVGWDPEVRAGSTITTIRMALTRGLALTVVTPEGSTGRLTPAKAAAWAESVNVEPWREQVSQAAYQGLLDLVGAPGLGHEPALGAPRGRP